MGEEEAISNIAKQTLNVLDMLTSFTSTRCIQGVNRLEDECSLVRAVVCDSEIQKLHLEMARTPLRDLLQMLGPTYQKLQFLFSQQQVSSLWRRLALDRTRLRGIKLLIRILEIARRSNEWKYLETCALDIIKEVRESTSNMGTNHPAGRESDKRNIVKLLLGTSSKPIDSVPVVSIFGAKGLGKSKLAKAVFDDNSIVDEFETLRFWVNVREELEVKNVVEKIIECIVGSKTEDLPLDTLKDLLDKLIFDKKFLLVLDDFSDEDREKWDELMHCLEGCGDGSRIIVVTRNESLANRVSSLTKYVLQGLSTKESLALWDLDVPEGVEYNEFEKVKEDIVNKCRKNPLNIEVIGKVLRYKTTDTELLNFMRQVVEKLDGSDSCALELSYSCLPPLVQRCFLYCGLFPRGEDIDVENLIHHWMAHQYIIRPEGSEESLEDIGLQYFECLVRRSFLIAGESDELGSIKTCKLHNAIHDLATKLAASSGHRVFREPKEKEKMEAFDDIETRHVSFPFHFNSKLTEKCSFNAQRLRTFLLPKQDIMKSNEGQFRDSFSRDVLTKFKDLYVCDLHSSGIVKVPSCIQKLECLRYLNLSDNDEIKILPDEITKLRYLQVLNVSGCQMLEKLPKNIRKLINLRHLYCHRCWNLKYMPSGIGELTELRTLSWFVVAEDSSLFTHIGGLEELEGLKNLRQFEIRNLKHLKGGKSECEKAKLQDKKHLQSLTLRWNHDEDDNGDAVVDVVDFDLDLQLNENLKRLMVRDYKGVTFPIRFSKTKNLVHISIKNGGRCVSLPPLDHIETLECLSIENFPCLVNIDYHEDNANGVDMFKSLRQLCLSKCPNLKGWSKDNDSGVLGIQFFKSDLSTEIKDCPKFKPEFPKAEDKPTVELTRTATGQFQQIQSHRRQQHKRQSAKRASAIIRDILQTSTGNLKYPIKWKASAIIEDVESIPEEMLKNMSSFQKLHISNCPKLLSLPKSLQHCTTLQELEISGCPLLEASCQEENAIVAHIPYIKMNAEYIKWDGKFQSNPIKAPIQAPTGRRIRFRGGAQCPRL